MKHGKRAVFVEESDGEGAARDPREAEADAFAQECLMPSADYEPFCLNGDFSLTDRYPAGCLEPGRCLLTVQPEDRFTG
jgi:hypothetical protein